MHNMLVTNPAHRNEHLMLMQRWLGGRIAVHESRRKNEKFTQRANRMELDRIDTLGIVCFIGVPGWNVHTFMIGVEHCIPHCIFV